MNDKDYVSYAQKCWDAGNLAVTLMYGLAFAVYYALIVNRMFLPVVSDKLYWLIGLSILGNAGLAVVIQRFYAYERKMLELAQADPEFLKTIALAFQLRLILLGVNAVMYLFVLIFIRWHVLPGKLIALVP